MRREGKKGGREGGWEGGGNERKEEIVRTCSLRHGKKCYNNIIVIFAKNALFGSCGVICLP